MPEVVAKMSDDSYLQLVQAFPLRRISTAAGHSQAKAVKWAAGAAGPT